MTALLRLTPFTAALLLAGVTGVQAQTGNRSVVQVPQRAAPSASTGGAVSPGAPSPTGLASPTPFPGGLSSRFPAGLPSPSPFPAGMPPVASPTLASPGTPAPGTMVTPPADGTVFMPAIGTGTTANGNGYAAAAAANAAMGAAGTGPSGAQRTPSGPGPYTPLQLAQSFLLADTNQDGQLTRAEAQRLSIMPMAFDEMDSNHDGVISRSEYENSTR